MFLRFPFNPPGYGVKRRPANDIVAFEIVRCPISDYLRTQDATDLCVGAWCNLDYALAEAWGGKLDRASTLAAGDSQCSFRFSPTKPAQKQPAGSTSSPGRRGQSSVEEGGETDGERSRVWHGG